MIHAANERCRPTISGLKGSVGDSAQIRFATPSPRSSRASRAAFELSRHSRAEMLGSKPDPVPGDRLSERRSFSSNRPDGVVLAFQVGADEVEPASGGGNGYLLAKDRVRAALSDEPEPGRPEMALVGNAETSARFAEGLTGA